MKDYEKQLDEADKFLISGEIEHGKSIIQKLLDANPTNSDVHRVAVNVLLNTEFYEDALSVFKRFKENTGKGIKKADFTEKQIRQFISDNQEIRTNENGELVFEYLSLRKRGFLSGMRRIFPYKKLLLGDEHISLINLFGKKTFLFSEIKTAKIVQQLGAVGYLDTYVQWVFVIESKSGKKMMIDISPAFPDYKGNRKLINELKRRLNVEFDKYDEKRRRKIFIMDWPLFCLLTSLIIFWILRAMQTGALMAWLKN